MAKIIIDEPILLTGTSNPQLAEAIGKLVGVPVSYPVTVFADKEIRVRVQPNMRQRTVFILQTTSNPGNDRIMELIFMADAARRGSASEIIAIIPYFGYSRQDRKEMPRVPISSSVVVTMLANAGIDRIITVDIHSQQQQGFTQKPWDNLFGSYVIIPVIKERNLSDLVIASPDKGGILQATAYAKFLDAKEIAVVYKKRDITLNDVSNALAMIGDVKGRDVLIVDDIISTGGTIVNAAKHLKKNGAKSVRVTATHGIFAEDALEQIDNSGIDEVIITDSIAPSEKISSHPKITIVSVAPLLAEAIRRIRTGESISSLIF